MKRDFDAKHPSLRARMSSILRTKLMVSKKTGLILAASTNSKTWQPLKLHIWWLSEKAKNPHTIAKELLLPASKDIVRVMLGAEYVNKWNTISLSNSTVSRRIDDMSADIMEQVIQEMKSAPLGIFIIQPDESTDVANCSQLLVYMRYIYEGDFKDEFLFCKPLETTTTACDVFNKVGSSLQNQDIPWGNVCGVCTDGAAAMLGCRSGFQQLVINALLKAIGTHCMIH